MLNSLISLHTLKFESPLTEAKRLTGILGIFAFANILWRYIPSKIALFYPTIGTETEVFFMVWLVTATVVFIISFFVKTKLSLDFKLMAAIMSILSVPLWLAVVTTNILFSATASE